MQILSDRFEAAGRADTALVLLAPAQAGPGDLLARGFISDVRQRGIGADILLPDIPYASVIEQTAGMSLGEGVIGPARAAGYREVWLAGISLGAFNALHYAVDHPGDLAGIVLLAPYPGAGDVVAEMALAGGPIAWARTAPGQAEDERKWWRWLCQQSMTGHWQTAVYLGAGHEDRFFRGQSMLATLLPENHVRWIPGHHDWTTWQALWRHWLDNGPLSGRCP